MDIIPLSVPDLTVVEENAVAECVRSTWVSSAGPEIAAFEREVAELCQRKYAIATCTGTAALQLMLTSLGIGAGHKVILPNYCFAATANAIIHAGAEPVFVDVTRLNWVLDVELVEQALEADEGIKAILAVDVLNNFPDYETLQALADKYGCVLLEDGAGALAASTNGKAGGSFGKASIVSFNGNKVVTTGGGGMMLTDVESIASHARHLSSQARGSADYSHDAAGFNFRMPNLNAAMGRAQISRLPEMMENRRKILAAYQSQATKMKNCQLQPYSFDVSSNGWLTSLLFDEAVTTASFIEHMSALKIMVRGFWKPLHNQVPYQLYRAYLNGVSEDIAPRIVTLPSSSNLSQAELERILQGMDRWKA